MTLLTSGGGGGGGVGLRVVIVKYSHYNFDKMVITQYYFIFLSTDPQCVKLLTSGGGWCGGQCRPPGCSLWSTGFTT